MKKASNSCVNPGSMTVKLLNPQKTLSLRLSIRSDAFALIAVAALFIALLAASWHRWLHPVIDHGREINLPARILAGEALYRDTQFLYGPFAPYFNALLYRLFGVHLSVLHASGIVCALLITLMVYWLARQLMSAWEAAVTTGFVLAVCAFQPGGNYIQPYAYAALYSLVFAIAVQVGVALYLKCGRAHWLFLAGLFAGLSAISKWELALAAVVAAVTALALDSFSARRLLWREMASFVSPALLIIVLAFALVLRRVEWRVLLDDNHVFFTNVPPQLIYFNRLVSGLIYPRSSLLYSLSGLGVAAWWAGAVAFAGAAVSWRSPRLDAVKRAAVVIILGTAWWALIQWRWNFLGGVTPFSAAAILLPLVVIFIGWQAWRARSLKATVPIEERLLLVIAVFGFVSIFRAIFNVTMSGPYTPFFLPVVIIAYLALLFRYAPRFFAHQEGLRVNMKRVALALVALAVIRVAYNSIETYRADYTFQVQTPRGEFITTPLLGRPFAEALRYAQEHTSPGEYIVSLPQLTAINFFADRPYPLREEIVLPGLLKNEPDAIERIKSRRVRTVLLCNLETPDFRDRFFGIDYNRELLGWIKDNCRIEASFDSEGTHGAEYGGKGFIVAYKCIP
jgi:Dolichyl-phosphate-mannose-protein mannosyltransferase